MGSKPLNSTTVNQFNSAIANALRLSCVLERGTSRELCGPRVTMARPSTNLGDMIIFGWNQGIPTCAASWHRSKPSCLISQGDLQQEPQLHADSWIHCGVMCCSSIQWLGVLVVWNPLSACILVTQKIIHMIFKGIRAVLYHSISFSLHISPSRADSEDPKPLTQNDCLTQTWQKTIQVRNTRKGGLLFVAPPCSTWVFMPLSCNEIT